MKLIQLNAWGGKLDRSIASYFEQEKPDIACLQEIISIEKEEGGLFCSLGKIQKLIGADYEVFAPVFSFRYMSGVARFGNAILSKKPFTKSEFFFTHLEHQDEFDVNDHTSNMRNVVHAVVNISEKRVHVLTHHGYHIDAHKNGDDDTLEQMGIIADYIDDLEGPVILTGDFNLAPHSISLDRLNRHLTNLSVKYGLKTTRNELVHKTEVCDYIFVNDEVKVRSFTASDATVSDHKALVLEFEV